MLGYFGKNLRQLQRIERKQICILHKDFQRHNDNKKRKDNQFWKALEESFQRYDEVQERKGNKSSHHTRRASTAN